MIARLRRRRALARRDAAGCVCGHARSLHDDSGEGPCVEGWICSLTDGVYVWKPVARFCLCTGFFEHHSSVWPVRERLHCGPHCECHRAQPRPALDPDNARRSAYRARELAFAERLARMDTARALRPGDERFWAGEVRSMLTRAGLRVGDDDISASQVDVVARLAHLAKWGREVEPTPGLDVWPSIWHEAIAVALLETGWRVAGFTREEPGRGWAVARRNPDLTRTVQVHDPATGRPWELDAARAAVTALTGRETSYGDIDAAWVVQRRLTGWEFYPGPATTGRNEA